MAAGGTSTNVAVGPGRLWVAPLGTTLPTDATTVLPSAWLAIGYTDQGHELAADLTSEPIEVAEEIDPIRYENTRRISRVTFAMAETTKRNLAIALGHGAAQTNDATAYNPPDAGTEVAVILVWDSDETAASGNVRWIYLQCKPSGTITLNHAKSPAKALLPVTFNLEKPTGLPPFRVIGNSSGHVA